MKIFTRTLLFFIAVIIFQSGLTIFFITNITKRNNLEDALKELKYEGTVVSENYNSWKRGIWKSLIELQAVPQMSLFLDSRQDIFLSNPFKETLKDFFRNSGIDILVVKNPLYGQTHFIPVTYNNFSLADVKNLERRKPHPYLELRILGNQLCMIGIIQLETSGENSVLDLFVIKRIDEAFCQSLVLNREAHTAFFWDEQYLTGTLDKMRITNLPIMQQLDSVSYDLYEIEMEEAGYNMAVQSIEPLHLDHPESRLFLVTMLSNASYITRLTVLGNTVLYVTLLSALLSLILGLFLTKNITQPVKNLYGAMRRIRKGKYDTTVEAVQERNEIGELVQGFNEMARKIRQDKEKMEQYIREITHLKDYNETIIQSIRAGILIVNHNLVIEKTNNPFLVYFNLDEQAILQKNIRHLQLGIFDDGILNHIQAILRKTEEEYTKILRAKKNKVYEIKLYPIDHPAEDDAEVINMAECVVVVEDISRKIEFEEKIFQAEKLSSISMLSAGVAHEINNPLSSIMTNVQNLMEEEEEEEKSVALRWIEQETRRIAKIVQQLLNFSSSELDRSRGTDVNEVIAETMRLLTYSLKKEQDITITTDFEENLPLAVMSPDELKQIIINLVKNAIQAIEHKGTLVLATRGEREHKTIRILVEDNGPGIPEDRIPRIFDPFYTTKQTGEGTGLGLSIVYGIINKSNGTITVASQEGQGTQIQLAIPVYPPQT